MHRVIAAPGSYVQGPGELMNLGAYCKRLGGKTAYVIIDEFVYDKYKESIISGCDGLEREPNSAVFGGQCSKTEVNRHTESAKDSDVIIGIGGGKVLDCAKAAAFYLKKPVVIVPTAASSDAPCSRLSVLYHSDGAFDEYLYLPKNPDVVLVDTEIIAGAPARLLAAGMGDALATYYEARACSRSGALTPAGGKCSDAALALARLCLDTLMSDGEKAFLSVSSGSCTEAVENVTEANIFLSGIGFESGGLAAAHAIHNGLTMLPECHGLLHGEKVAFGVLTQLVLENESREVFEKTVAFCRSVGLPVTLRQLGLDENDRAKLLTAARAACAENETMSNMPFKVDGDSVVSAMLLANSLSTVSK